MAVPGIQIPTTGKEIAMKLFVWRNVLTVYTDGIAVAMAKDVDEARAVIVNSEPEICERPFVADEISGPPDEVHDKPAGAFCWGGG